HREGIGIDSRASSIKDMLPSLEVAVQNTELLCDQLLSRFDHRASRRFAFVDRVAIGHEDRPEGRMNVRGEECRPTMCLSLGAQAVTAGKSSLRVLVSQII